MTTTNIEWADQVWNPLVGCTVHSPGCTYCYAMRMAYRLTAMAEAGNAGLDHYRGTTRMVNGNPVWTGTVNLAPETTLLAPLRRKKPTRYFVNSMSDLFHADVPDEWIDRIFAVMALCPQHTFQVLTKRSDRMRDYLSETNKFCDGGAGRVASNTRLFVSTISLSGRPVTEAWPLPNVWLGVSVEDQTRADQRIPDLLATPAAVRWISAEPLLGPVNLNHIKMVDYVTEGGGSVQGWESALNGKRFDEWADGDSEGWSKLDWIVVGGESGPNARPMNPDWARSLRDQCAAEDVPFFFKQWGEWADFTEWEKSKTYPVKDSHHWPWLDINTAGQVSVQVGKKAAGRLLDGIEHNAMPGAAHA